MSGRSVSGRQVGWAGAGMAGALAVLSACSAAGEDAEAPQAVAAGPVNVEVVRVTPADRANVVRASGLTAYKSETLLSFGAPGQIDSLLVDAGDVVRAGQTLATLRRTSTGADAAESEIVRLTAQQTFDRVTRLFENGAASQADLDAARLNLERSREKLAIKAPAGGVILRRDVERGQIVNAGQAVLAIGEAATGVIVRASVASGDVSRIVVGAAVEVVVRGRDKFAGKVARISPKSTDGMGSFEIEVQVEAPGDLRSGEVAEVFMTTGETVGGGALTGQRFIVPAIALIDARADQGMVFVIDSEGVARRRAVQTEGLVDGGVIVVDGLVEGDAVISRGASMLRDGDAVATR